MKKQTITSVLLMALLIMGFWGARAQTPTYNCELRNDTLTAAGVYEFDIYLVRTGTNVFEYAAGQYGITVNSAIKAGTVTANLVANNGLGYLTKAAATTAGTTLVSDLPTGWQPNSITFTTATNCIKISAGTTATGCFISNVAPGTRVARIRLQTTTSFLQFQPNPTWSFTTNPYQTQISAYISGVNTAVTASGTFTTSALANPILNGPVTSTYSVTGTGSYCQGSGGLPVGLGGSQTPGIKYRVYSGSTPLGSWTNGTGSAMTFDNQLAGTYTVKGHRTATYMYADMAGSAVLTENPNVSASVTIAESANNTWPGTMITFTPTPTGGGSPTYQWFVNSVSAGAGATYSYAPVNGDQVYAQMTSTVACASPNPSTSNTINMAVTGATWTGNLNINWGVPGNWLPNAVPGSGLSVKIPAVSNLPTVNANGPASPAEVNGMLIESGASVTVADGNALTIHGTVTNNGGSAGLVVESGGSLIQSTVGVPGTANRFIGNWTVVPNHGWHFVSSPVASQSIQPGWVPSTPTVSEDFYAWNEVTGYWDNSKNEPSPPFTFNTAIGTTFEAGKGYLVAYETDQTKQFTGLLNVADVPRSLTNTAANTVTGGWNLAGNPFTSAIAWNNAWAPSNLAAIAKIWNEGNASYSDIGAGAVIPALQGFMVFVPGVGSSTTMTIPAAARQHSATAWYKATGNPYIKLVAHNPAAQTAQESVVTFDNQAGAGYNPSFDSKFLAGYAPQFYSVDGQEHLSTNVLTELTSQTTVPMNFVKNAEQQYTIEATQIDNVPAEVYLTDLKLNLTQNLKENPVYSFSAEAEDGPARFLLSFSHVGIDEKTGIHSIYSYENNLFIVNPGKAKLEVWSMTGQRMLSTNIDSPTLYRTTLYVPTAYYMVRLTTGSNVIVKKVFIKS